MLQVLRERLTLILIGLLPFHAFLVTVGTRVVKGSDQSPWIALAMWKEVLVLLILGVTLLELSKSYKLTAISHQLSDFRFQKTDVYIVVLVLLSIVLLLFGKPESIQQFAYGFKYTLFPLVLFLILRRVQWSERFKGLCVKVLLGAGAIVSVYGIASMVLPQGFFHFLGYSKLHSLYIPEGPVAAFQQIGSMGLRRAQSTMSGPNQLGLWLLLPYSIALQQFLRKYKGLPAPRSLGGVGALLLLLGLCLILTFSRAAWIAAAVVTVFVVWHDLPRSVAKKITVRAVGVFVLAIAFAAFVTPQVILRSQSSIDHIRRPLEAIQTIVRHPLGLGLGTAGPASNRFSDACVHLEEGADASWAAVHPDLCVFVGSSQVQPADRVCTCPSLPENWYLQVGIELGVIGLALFVLLVLILLRSMLRNMLRNTLESVPESLLGKPDSDVLKLSLVATFVGVSIACLFLHAWEDSAVAYGVWLLLAVVF